MILDSIILTWCREHHDTTREAEYLSYAKYVADRPWIRGLRLHTAFLWVVFVLMLAVTVPRLPTVTASTVFPLFLQLMVFNGVFTLAFIPYGLKKYHLGDGTTLFFYVLMAFAINCLCSRLPQAGQYAFSIIMMPVSLLLHHGLPRILCKNGRQMRAFHAEQQLAADQAKAQMDKDEFDSWANRLQNTNPQDALELPEGTNQGYWAIQSWADLGVGRTEAMYEDSGSKGMLPEDDRGMLEDFDQADNLAEDFDDPVDPVDPVDSFYEDLDDNDY